MCTQFAMRLSGRDGAVHYEWNPIKMGLAIVRARGHRFVAAFFACVLLQVSAPHVEALADDLSTPLSEYVSEGMLGKTSSLNWRQTTVRRLKTAILNTLVYLPRRYPRQSDVLQMQLSKSANLIESTLKIAARLLNLQNSTLAFAEPSQVVGNSSIEILNGKFAVVVGADGDDTRLELDNAVKFVQKFRMFDVSVSLQIDGLGYGCTQLIIVTRTKTLSSILLIPKTATSRMAIHCSNHALLSTIGFRGYVRSVQHCESVRCANHPAMYLTEADVSMFSLLYSRDASDIVNAGQIYDLALESKNDPSSIQ